MATCTSLRPTLGPGRWRPDGRWLEGALVRLTVHHLVPCICSLYFFASVYHLQLRFAYFETLSLLCSHASSPSLLCSHASSPLYTSMSFPFTCYTAISPSSSHPIIIPRFLWLLFNFSRLATTSSVTCWISQMGCGGCFLRPRCYSGLILLLPSRVLWLLLCRQL